MKNKHLVLIFLSICFGGWVLRKIPSKSTGFFHKTLVNIDTSKVTEISLRENNGEESLVFFRNDHNWTLTKDVQTLVISPERMDSILDRYSRVHSLRIATDKISDWPQYGLGIGQGLLVQIKGNGTLMDEFVVSSCNNQANGAVFVRLNNSPEVYEIKEKYLCSGKPDFTAFRSRKVCATKEKDVKMVTISQPNLPEMKFLNQNGQWHSAQRDMMPAELTGRMACFFEALSGLKLEQFADDFDEIENKNRLVSEVVLIENRYNKEETVKLRCFETTINNRFFVFHSSQNPNSFFYSNDSLAALVFVKPFEWGGGVATLKDGNEDY